MGKTITVCIIAKNEEAMIANCMASLKFADEIIVVDSGSTDNTPGIAAREGAIVISSKGSDFAAWRNEGLAAATSDWLLYIDADERVTPKLSRQIIEATSMTSNTSFLLRRNNIHFGRWLQFGGWQQDKLVRLFLRSALKKWEGRVHEHAIIEGACGQIEEPLVHLTHRNMADGLRKSVDWTNVEAELLFTAHARKVTVLTLIRKPLFEIIRRLIFKRGFKDGTEGWIESFQQGMNRFLVYERLWELQQKPSLEDRYERFELEIQKLWQPRKA